MQKDKLVNSNVVKSKSDDFQKALSLLRRYYKIIEESHLNDFKMTPFYCDLFRISRKLGEETFNLLQSKDQTFRDIAIKLKKL